MTPISSLLIFSTFFIVSLALGLTYRISSDNILEYSFPYDDKCSDSVCSFPVSIPETISKPVYLYYELTHFYQNHFLYSSSRSDSQLSGGVFKKESDVEKCRPLKKKDDKILVPCGSAALSMFNETIQVVGVSFESESIINPALKKAYKSAHSSYTGNNFNHWMTLESEQADPHFISWMVIAPFRSFRKLYGISHEDLVNGSYTIKINGNYDVNTFFGTKSIVFSEKSWTGGKNSFFGNYLIVISGLSFGSIIIILIFYFFNLFPLYKAVIHSSQSLENMYLQNSLFENT